MLDYSDLGIHEEALQEARRIHTSSRGSIEVNINIVESIELLVCLPVVDFQVPLSVRCACGQVQNSNSALKLEALRLRKGETGIESVG